MTDDKLKAQQESVEKFGKELEQLLSKYGLKMRMGIDFPTYKVLPIDLQLALQLVEKHGGQFQLSYEVEESKK